MDEKLHVKIIVSEDIETQTNGIQQRQIIVNPIIQMRTAFIPTSLSLAVSVIMAGMEPNKNYQIEISLSHVESKKVIFSTGLADIIAPPQTDNFVANVDLKNIEIEQEGLYSVNFVVNQERYTEEFYISKRSGSEG